MAVHSNLSIIEQNRSIFPKDLIEQDTYMAGSPSWTPTTDSAVDKLEDEEKAQVADENDNNSVDSNEINPSSTDKTVVQTSIVATSEVSNEDMEDATTVKTPKSQRKYERKTKRFVWPESLHRLFVAAIFDVGLKHASPKALLALMGDAAPSVGLTTEHLKSHLQKYRRNYSRSREEFLEFFDESVLAAAVNSSNAMNDERGRTMKKVKGSGTWSKSPSGSETTGSNSSFVFPIRLPTVRPSIDDEESTNSNLPAQIPAGGPKFTNNPNGPSPISFSEQCVRSPRQRLKTGREHLARQLGISPSSITPPFGQAAGEKIQPQHSNSVTGLASSSANSNPLLGVPNLSRVVPDQLAVDLAFLNDRDNSQALGAGNAVQLNLLQRYPFAMAFGANMAGLGNALGDASNSASQWNMLNALLSQSPTQSAGVMGQQSTLNPITPNLQAISAAAAASAGGDVPMMMDTSDSSTNNGGSASSSLLHQLASSNEPAGLQLQMHLAMQAQMNIHRQMLTRKVEVSQHVAPPRSSSASPINNTNTNTNTNTPNNNTNTTGSGSNNHSESNLKQLLESGSANDAWAALVQQQQQQQLLQHQLQLHRQMQLQAQVAQSQNHDEQSNQLRPNIPIADDFARLTAAAISTQENVSNSRQSNNNQEPKSSDVAAAYNQSYALLSLADSETQSNSASASRLDDALDLYQWHRMDMDMDVEDDLFAFLKS